MHNQGVQERAKRQIEQGNTKEECMHIGQNLGIIMYYHHHKKLGTAA